MATRHLHAVRGRLDDPLKAGPGPAPFFAYDSCLDDLPCERALDKHHTTVLGPGDAGTVAGCVGHLQFHPGDGNRGCIPGRPELED